ncbi:Macrocin-O-methyltransferase (TylF) [Paenisporosarcina quisquiliarum]|nr:Macrocin-O-methyltransferase (TylF) [Paenisporosarcina quisquiliarum]
MKKVILFGTSGGLKETLNMLDLRKIKILKYIDSDETKHGKILNGIEIACPSEVRNIEFDFIIITSRVFYVQMYARLLELEVDSNKIILLPQSNRAYPKKLIEEHYINYQKELMVFKDELVERNSQFGIITLNKEITSKEINFYDYPDYLLKGPDYVRSSTAELIARLIKDRDITGAVAELGVYKGDFTKLLSNLFPKRELVLFDTFKGFNENDVKFEARENFSNAEVGRFGDTNEELVLGKILDPQRVSLVKGFFPDSTKDIKDRAYSFVSIDVDLYKPTIEGLKYFYKSLSPGGYILVHDYNVDYYAGVKKAVDDFITESDACIVPICDYNGSVVIAKSINS